MSAISITHKIALKPNNKHITYFKKAFGCARLAYNWGLAKWKENYQLGIRTNHLQLKKEFNALKKSQFNFVYEVTKYATQQPFIHLNLAFNKFFRDLKKGLVSYPKFKKKREFQGSFYIGGDQIKIIQTANTDYLKIPNLPPIKLTEKLRFQGKIHNATITQKGDHFYVSISCGIDESEYKRTHKLQESHKMRRLNALSDNAFLPLLLSLFTIQLVGRSANEQPYTTKELEGLLEHLERFGFLIYGVAGKNTAKNEWIELAFMAFKAYRYGEENIVIENLPTLEKNFFNRQGNSGLELLEEYIHSKKNTEKWYQWGKALNYLLYEYELYHNPETTLNFDSSLESIEHILSQKPDQGYSAKEKDWAKNPHVVHALGNLLLIPKNANSSLSNKPFDEKRKAYLKGSYSEKEVAKNASFGVAQIKERSEKLLDFLIARYRIAELVGESAIKTFKNALLKDIE
ncbi:DUF1524 domain-containing protein [Helicobacter pylori]|nr:DUF1524 domain-containing protein [Helicobacter pylori]